MSQVLPTACASALDRPVALDWSACRRGSSRRRRPGARRCARSCGRRRAAPRLRSARRSASARALDSERERLARARLHVLHQRRGNRRPAGHRPRRSGRRSAGPPRSAGLPGVDLADDRPGRSGTRNRSRVPAAARRARSARGVPPLDRAAPCDARCAARAAHVERGSACRPSADRGSRAPRLRASASPRRRRATISSPAAGRRARDRIRP